MRTLHTVCSFDVTYMLAMAISWVRRIQLAVGVQSRQATDRETVGRMLKSHRLQRFERNAKRSDGRGHSAVR